MIITWADVFGACGTIYTLVIIKKIYLYFSLLCLKRPLNECHIYPTFNPIFTSINDECQYSFCLVLADLLHTIYCVLLSIKLLSMSQYLCHCKYLSFKLLCIVQDCHLYSVCIIGIHFSLHLSCIFVQVSSPSVSDSTLSDISNHIVFSLLANDMQKAKESMLPSSITLGLCQEKLTQLKFLSQQLWLHASHMASGAWNTG